MQSCIWSGTFCASGLNTPLNQQQQEIAAPDPNTISIRGVVVDRIQALGSEWDPHWLRKLDCHAALKFLSEIGSFCASSPRYTADPELAAMRIAIADRYNYIEPERQPELREGYAEAMKYLEKGAAGEENDPYALLGLNREEEEEKIEWFAPWYVFCLKNLHSRRPFVSESGYVGLVPRTARLGDEIVIFLGGRAAYLVRERKGTGEEEEAGSSVEGEMYHELIGECFAHGIMYGEFMDSEEVRQRPENGAKTFWLR